MRARSRNPFRRPHDVFIVQDSKIVNGVIKPGDRVSASAMFSVQSIKDAQQIESLKEGRRLSDWRRLYSDTRLPLIGELVDITSGDLTTSQGVLVSNNDELIHVGTYVGKSGMGNPAIVVIDGYEYEVIHREPWQNGIIPHYKYFVVRRSYG